MDGRKNTRHVAITDAQTFVFMIVSFCFGGFLCQCQWSKSKCLVTHTFNVTKMINQLITQQISNTICLNKLNRISRSVGGIFYTDFHHKMFVLVDIS